METQIENAIRRAVQEHDQSPELSNKIIAWLKALTSGNEQINDSQRATQHTAVIYEAIVVGVEGED